ncbi:metal ABC transporter ATP-binding protein [Atopobacter phocae]|uniref:metal ABC transporter ATP-binding protein n=1 Tax=Atopobacter phocae TaxID=136492 RepID=UPI0004709F9F|nr:metal ABC transporter ATP-binding protein [Atopobacter phocae]
MLEVKNVSVTYNNQVQALSNINLKIAEPSIIGVIGPNGAGKSTLIKAMLHVIPFEGDVLIDNDSIKSQLKEIAYIEQKSNLDFSFPITVRDCVSLGTYPNVGVFKRLKAKDWKDVDYAIEQVGLSEFKSRQISELSGGQFQRVLMARCLVQQAKYIFLDEPFVGIDAVSEQIIMETLIRLKEDGKTIIIVHHDLSKVRTYFDQLIILNKELITFGPVDDVFTKENLISAYGDNIFVDAGGAK